MALEPPVEIYSRKPWLWDCSETYDEGDAHERCVARSKVWHARLVVSRDEECLAAYERSRMLVEAVAPHLSGTVPPARACYTIEALAADERLGYLNLVYTEDGTAVIHWVWVKPRYRGYGLGKRLVEKALEHARRHGARRVTALVLDYHPLVEVEPARMKRILEDLGFCHLGDDHYVLELEG